MTCIIGGAYPVETPGYACNFRSVLCVTLIVFLDFLIDYVNFKIGKLLLPSFMEIFVYHGEYVQLSINRKKILDHNFVLE